MKNLLLVLAAGAMLGGLAARTQAVSQPAKACDASVSYDPTDPNSPPMQPGCTCQADPQ